MGNLIRAWDGAAETAIRDRYFDEPTQTMHEYIEAEKDKCWQTMKKNAGLTFVGCEMMLDPCHARAFPRACNAGSRPARIRRGRRIRGRDWPRSGGMAGGKSSASC